MKKLLCMTILLTTMLSFASCSLKVTTKPEESSNISSQDNDFDKRGFDSSKDAIEAYWQAFDDVKGFEDCFPVDPKGIFTIDELIAEQYENAKSNENSIVITDVNVTNKTIYDLDNFDFDIKQLEITKAELNTVTVYMDQLLEDSVLKVEDYYEFITVKIDGRWYVLNINDIGAKVIEDSETTTKTHPLQSESTTEKFTEENSLAVPDTIEPSANPFLTDDVATALKYVQTDYSKISWGIEYSPIENLPGVVFSATLTKDDIGYILILGITNLHDRPITINAEGYAKDLNGDNTGDFYIFADTIGSGNTVINTIRCDNIPSGEIHWDNIEAKDSYKTYVPWEADWNIKVEDNKSILNYTVSSSNEYTVGDVYGLGIDDNGFVTCVFHSYESNANNNFTGQIDSYINAAELGVTDIALFINPTTVK